MKTRVDLTGGISLKSLTASGDSGSFDFDNFEGDSFFAPIQDVWPIDDLGHDIYSRDFESDFDVLACAVQLLAASPSANSLIREAMDAHWQIGLANLEGRDFHLDVPEKIIILDKSNLTTSALARSGYFRHGLLMSLVRCLRDIWHEKRHGGFDQKFEPESIMALERVRAADCQSFAVLSAWELRAAGYGDVWRHVLACDEGDMAMAFSEVLERNITNYPMHNAMGSAFRQWYRDETRVTTRDHETLEYMDELLRNAAPGQAFGKTRAMAADVEILSCLPDRTAYLQRSSEEILRAPLYVGLQNIVNQSHFMQIMHDSKVTYVQDVPFRDAALAEKIFPGGSFAPEMTGLSEKR